MSTRSCLVSIALVGLVASCGGGGSGAGPTDPAAAAIAVTATPLAWVAVECPPSHCGPLVGELEAMGALAVRETAGVGGRVDRIDGTARGAAGGELFRLEFDSTSVAREAGTNRIAGLGSLTVPVALHFSPSARATSVVFTVQFVDDRGNRVSSVASVTLS